MNSENTLWISNIQPDRTHAHLVCNLNNEHIANIIHFFRTKDITQHGHSLEESAGIIDLMMEEVQKRELTPEFLNGAPYSYDPSKPYIEYGQG